MSLNASAKNYTQTNTQKNQDTKRHSLSVETLNERAVCLVYPNGEVIVCQG